jgi:nicotinamidase-related amidase
MRTTAAARATMPAMPTALLLIDVQQSFTRRPHWGSDDVTGFLARCNELITGCAARGVPVVRVLHRDGPDTPDNPFSAASGLVRPLDGLTAFDAAITFEKQRHSALVGTLLGVWLRERGIGRLMIAGIRTEQCCETTARHASDEGFEVDFVLEATATTELPGLPAALIKQRTAAVLEGRFAHISTVQQALQRAAAPQSGHRNSYSRSLSSSSAGAPPKTVG